MDSFIVNQLERRLGMDINGDGYIGGEGRLGMLERRYGIDINGDGRIGRPADVVPGFPGALGYPTMAYGPFDQVIPTTGFVGRTPYHPTTYRSSTYF